MVTPLRRLAIATSKTEECVRFYSQVLGMKKFYDDVMTNAPGVKSLLGPEGRFPQRLVSMQINDYTFGMMGLLEYLNAPFTVKPLAKKAGGLVYPVCVDFVVRDVSATVRKVEGLGYQVIAGPISLDTACGKTTASAFLDPNGVLVQVIDRADDSTPTPSAIRRVIFPVARERLEGSVRLLRESLGMDIYREEVVDGSEHAALFGLNNFADFKARIVTLRQGDEGQGMVSFMEVVRPSVDIEPFVKRENYPYEVIMVFFVDGMDAVLAKAQALGGALIGRRTYEVPGRGMAEGAMFTDASGIVIDVTRWL
ncbi:MAG: VOC family protein [Dehalococcoidia bacterium]|nr:VOC family protein [Dehalococcoidia bacterium]